MLFPPEYRCQCLMKFAAILATLLCLPAMSNHNTLISPHDCSVTTFPRYCGHGMCVIHTVQQDGKKVPQRLQRSGYRLYAYYCYYCLPLSFSVTSLHCTWDHVTPYCTTNTHQVTAKAMENFQCKWVWSSIMCGYITVTVFDSRGTICHMRFLNVVVRADPK